MERQFCSTYYYSRQPPAFKHVKSHESHWKRKGELKRKGSCSMMSEKKKKVKCDAWVTIPKVMLVITGNVGWGRLIKSLNSRAMKQLMLEVQEKVYLVFTVVKNATRTWNYMQFLKAAVHKVIIISDLIPTMFSKCHPLDFYNALHFFWNFPQKIARSI